MMTISENLTFFTPDATSNNLATLIDCGISAGFPSVTEDITNQLLPIFILGFL